MFTDDEAYKQHIKYVIAGLILLVEPLDHNIIKTLPRPERKEIESLICEVALHNDLKRYALYHLMYGYPKAFALYCKGGEALTLYYRTRDRAYAERLREKSINCFRKLHKGVRRIIHEIRQGILRGICPVCLMLMKAKEQQ